MSLEGFANAISQPVTKLIEVCAKGIGVLYEPYHLVRMAEAQKKAKEISGPSEIVGSQNIDGDLITQSLEGNPSTLIGGVPADSILINSKTRKQFQEEMHQKNIENIIGCAYKELKHEKNVSSETIDQSWLDIFFNSAEHIFDENLQVLWGKVMAGEIKQPGLYSLKTLSVLKVLSKKDAEKFAEISNSVFKKDDIFFIWAEKKLLLASGSNLLEKEDLVSLNLLNSESLVWTCFGNNQKQEWFEYGCVWC